MLRNKKKLILTILVMCLIGLVGIGMSYAYWRFTYMQTDKNIAVSKCLKLEMTNEKDEINLSNMYPISDEAGRSLTPYSFKITNTCSMSAEYSVNLEMLEGTTMNSKYLATLVNNGDIKLLNTFDEAKTTISGSTESRILDTGILTPGASKEYSISLWMDKSVTLSDDAQNKSFSAKVVIDAVMSTKTIQDMILSQLDTTGKCPAVNEDGTVNVTSAESENSLLCSAKDNYGTSYYYRGNVQNNYVKFAGFYWRIVRIDGDGSIRMIYDGTSAHENGEANEDRIIGTSAFNEQNDDNAYVGYMYGTPDSLTYEETHANINDSTIKKYIDTWYENNIKGNVYETYLADNLFCNDRSLAENNTGNGYKDSFTYYRWDNGPWEADYGVYNNKMSLLCSNENDILIVKNTSKNNSSLKYPISLINYDEVVLAGDYGGNAIFYLNSGYDYWSISPVAYNGTNAREHIVFKERWFQNVDNVSQQRGVKPVINLKANSLKLGDGTMDNPYTVE